MPWIKTSLGDFINSDLAPKGDRVTVAGHKLIQLKNERDTPLALVNENDLRPPEILVSGAVPAIFIEEDGSTSAVPVIGWSVNSATNQGEPVFMGPRPPGAMFLHLQNGALIGTDRRFPD